MEYLSNKSNCTNKPNIPIDITSNNDNNIDDKTLSVLISFKVASKHQFKNILQIKSVPSMHDLLLDFLGISPLLFILFLLFYSKYAWA